MEMIIAVIIFVNQEGDEQLKRLIADDYEQVLTGCGSMVIKTKGAEGCEIYLDMPSIFLHFVFYS